MRCCTAPAGSLPFSHPCPSAPALPVPGFLPHPDCPLLARTTLPENCTLPPQVDARGTRPPPRRPPTDHPGCDFAPVEPQAQALKRGGEHAGDGGAVQQQGGPPHLLQAGPQRARQAGHAGRGGGRGVVAACRVVPCASSSSKKARCDGTTMQPSNSCRAEGQGRKRLQWQVLCKPGRRRSMQSRERTCRDQCDRHNLPPALPRHARRARHSCLCRPVGLQATPGAWLHKSASWHGLARLLPWSCIGRVRQAWSKCSRGQATRSPAHMPTRRRAVADAAIRSAIPCSTRAAERGCSDASASKDACKGTQS